MRYPQTLSGPKTKTKPANDDNDADVALDDMPNTQEDEDLPEEYGSEEDDEFNDDDE